MKVCSKCKQPKALDCYYKSSRYKDGKQHRCKECFKAFTQAATKNWRIKHAESQKISTRKTKAKLKYGLELEEIYNMLEAQGSVCKICCKPISFKAEDKRNKPHIDHDHSTGQVRGLLCLTCNTGLGMFGDSPDLLERAKEYLVNVVQRERLSELASDDDDAIVRSHGNFNHEKLTEMFSSTDFICE